MKNIDIPMQGETLVNYLVINMDFFVFKDSFLQIKFKDAHLESEPEILHVIRAN